MKQRVAIFTRDSLVVEYVSGRAQRLRSQSADGSIWESLASRATTNSCPRSGPAHPLKVQFGSAHHAGALPESWRGWEMRPGVAL